MIKVNNMEYKSEHFPDNTLLMHGFQKQLEEPVEIQWYFENNEELVILLFLVQHLRDNGHQHLNLFMPYIPNARQDRVKGKEDVFTLKYFSKVINSMNFLQVRVADPHSTVSEALIHNIRIMTMQTHIEFVISKVSPQLLFYPDAGAAKRYGSMLKYPYVYGIKNRDWESGQIIGLDIVSNGEEIKGKDLLIIDDICSKGGTFYYSAKKLKELGAAAVYLYVTHCENTILDGELIKSGLITKIFTTNSIYTGTHELINTFDI